VQAKQSCTRSNQVAPFHDYWRDRTPDKRCRRLAERLPELLKAQGRQRIRNRAGLVDLAEPLIVNLAHHAGWHRRLLVSRDTSNRNPLPGLLDALERAGYVRQHIAPASPLGGCTTEVEPLPPLLDTLAPVAAAEILPELRAVVEMRDSAGQPVKVPARALRELTPPINRLNRRLRTVEMTLFGELLVAPQVRRVFNLDLEHGGRWYHPLQNRSKAERAALELDGEPVIELDFNALHPRLIYAREGMQYPLDRCPYRDACRDPDDDAERKAMKGIGFQVINDTSPEQAIAHLEARQHPGRVAAYHRHRAELAEWAALPPEQRTAPPRRPAGLWDTFEPLSPEIDVRAAVSRFLAAHESIAYTFSREGQALELQHADARIAERVIARCVERRWAVLPVHDSFIVQARHAAGLRTFMDDAYADETSGYRCPIK